MIARNLTLKVAIGAVLMVILLAGGQIIGSSGTQVRSFQSPLPTPILLPSPSPSPSSSPTPFPTISPDLPDAERALLFVAQRQDVPKEWLKLVDSSTVEFPLTGVTLWKGLVLDVKNRLHYLYEVFIDQSTKAILDDAQVDHLIYWQVEEKAFRQKYQERILELVACREKVAAEGLEIVWGGLSQDGERWIWQGKLVDRTTGIGYQAAMDDQGQEIDFSEAIEAEARARYARYGKLEPRLFYLLPLLAAEDKINVLLWVSSVDDAWVDQELARRYPQIKAGYFAGGQPFMGQGRPVNVTPELFAQIRADYNDLLDEIHRKAAEPVVAFLKKRGYEAEVLDAFPGISAELPVRVIQELNQAELGSLSNIYLGEMEAIPQMDSAGKTIRVQPVWSGGYTGQGVRLGIMDTGIVDPAPTHPAFGNKSIIVPASDNYSPHAAEVAGIMFGNDPNHPEYRGMAYGSAELVTVGLDNNASWSSINTGLNNLVDNNAFVIVVSLNLYGYRDMHPSDRVFDYVVRYRDPTIVTIAGNNSNQPPHQWYVNSPGKAYNAITVGGFEDQNNTYWSDDVWWDQACWQDPYIDDNTGALHTKPDVVAVSKDVMVIDSTIGNSHIPITGTSYAAPQVAGLAALVVQRYDWLRTNPETVKAIIMASAIHNIEGSTRLSDKDGAGGIVASEAMAIFDRGGWAHHIIVDINNFNDPSNPFDYSGDYYDFKTGDGIWDVGTTNAYKGERVRAVVCWNSNPSSSFGSTGTDQLSTDLDLEIMAPNGIPVQGVASSSRYNSCEIVDFKADQNGEYKMRVRYYRINNDSLNLGLGLAWLRVPALDSPDQYLPDIKGGYNGWTSEIVVRNNSAAYNHLNFAQIDVNMQRHQQG